MSLPQHLVLPRVSGDTKDSPFPSGSFGRKLYMIVEAVVYGTESTWHFFFCSVVFHDFNTLFRIVFWVTAKLIDKISNICSNVSIREMCSF